jgi:tetratricopeptide (TPR) repeat protein
VARKGARVVLERSEGPGRPRKPDERADRGGEGAAAWEPEVWLRDPPLPATPARPGRAGGARRAASPRRPTSDRSAAGARRPGGTPNAPAGGRAENAPRGGVSTAAVKQERRLAEAAKAYEADRYADARRLLRALVERGDASPAVRELHGLTLYRMGKWREAIAELEAFAAATRSFDQHPVLADCHRALRNWGAVEEVWEEIRHASPSPEVVAEGRIVAAGALADQGRISVALQLLDRGRSNVKRPALHHLRLWYAQADLYERAGEIPRARELFRAILRHEPDFVDAAERLTALD